MYRMGIAVNRFAGTAGYARQQFWWRWQGEPCHGRGHGADDDFALVRYHPDGSFDNSFSFDGQVSLDFQGGSDEQCAAMLIQPDGKIVVAGISVLAGNVTIALVRYLSDGTLDTSFDGDGMVLTDLGNTNEVVYDLAWQPDGKLLVSGAFVDGGARDVLLLRYLPDGSLDTDFSFDGHVSDGHVSLSIGASNDYGISILQPGDGRILVTGATEVGGGHDLFIARFESDGSLDYTFGSSGKITASYSSLNDVFWDAVYWNDRIIVAGQSLGATNYDIIVARFLSDGSPDTDFSFDGVVTTSFTIGGTDQSDEARALAVQPDGKILVVGATESGTALEFAVARYNWDGSLDLGFGSNGKAYTDFGGNDDRAFAIDLQPNGLLVMGGLAGMGAVNHFALARYFTGINVGVLRFDAAQDMQVYPNPIVEQAVLEYELQQTETLSIRLVNAQGQVVQSLLEGQVQAAGAYRQPISLESLPTGAYFLVLDNGGERVTVQVLKH